MSSTLVVPGSKRYITVQSWPKNKIVKGLNVWCSTYGYLFGVDAEKTVYTSRFKDSMFITGIHAWDERLTEAMKKLGVITRDEARDIENRRKAYHTKNDFDSAERELLAAVDKLGPARARRLIRSGAQRVKP